MIHRGIVWFVSISMVFHALNQILVKPKAKEFAICNQWLQDEPQAFFNLLQLDWVTHGGEVGVMGQHWYGENEHVVWQNVWQLNHSFFHCAETK